MNVYKTAIGLVCLAFAFTASAAPGTTEKAVKANNDFGFKFYQAIKRSEGDEAKNRLVSPVSAYFALAMTSNGARGATEEAIRATIAANHLTRDEMNRANLSLLDALNSREEIKLALANSVWTREGLGLLSTFAQSATKYYRAEARELDFGDPKSAEIINGWVAAKTNDKIKKIVENPIEEDFYLMNATYFKGSWRQPFDEARTKPASFLGARGKSNVPTMHGRLETQYVDMGGYEVVELPYGARHEASLLLFTTKDLGKLEADLSAEVWNEVNAKLESAKTHFVNLSLPKFTFEYESDLKPGLARMGMEIAFGPGADFLDLTRHNMVLSKAIQKTFINLDEKGTEAAAVTIIGGVTSVPMHPEVTVKADRPFLVAIRDNATNALLFLGSVVQP